MIDHATRLVIGEKVVIGDNVSLLHSVTIIAPKPEGFAVIEDDVLISAGASIIGNINIKKGAKVDAKATPPSATYPAAEAIIHCSDIPQS